MAHKIYNVGILDKFLRIQLTLIGYVYTSKYMKGYGFRAFALYDWGSSRFSPHTPFIIFGSSPFPPNHRLQEPFVREEDPNVEHDQVEPLRRSWASFSIFELCC